MTQPIDWAGPRRQPCPSCARSDRDRTCGVTIDDRGGVAHCFRCGHRETRDRDDFSPGARARAAAPRRQHESLSDMGQALWASCGAIAGDGLAYLEARACVIPPPDGHLRYHPSLRHPPSATVGPALVALVTDALTCRPLTLHRTWVRADGQKAAVTPARMLLGGHRKAGGVVRLWPDDYVTGGLSIGEGIETALSLAHAGAPAWAALDAGNLAELPVLGGIEVLTIAADHDDAGISAAEACGARWAATGRDVRIVMPDTPRTDINDLARAA